MIRYCILALGSCAALLAQSSAQAVFNEMPLGTYIPATALVYGGTMWHAGGGHHVLAPTLAECSERLNDIVANHNGDYPTHPDSFTIEVCGRRGAFRFKAPDDGGLVPAGDVTMTISVPAKYVRDMRELRQQYRVPEYEQEVLKLIEGE